MKTFRVYYENANILFGNKSFYREVEAESAKEAIAKVKYESEYILTNMSAEEI